MTYLPSNDPKYRYRGKFSKDKMNTPETVLIYFYDWCIRHYSRIFHHKMAASIMKRGNRAMLRGNPQSSTGCYETIPHTPGEGVSRR